MTIKKVLIIDDEPDIRELLSLTLQHMEIGADVAENFQQGISSIEQNDYFLVLTDMRLPDGNGFEVVRYIQQNKPEMPVAVITAYGNVEGAVNCLKAGAFDYVSKPIDLGMLKDIVNTAFRLQKIKPEVCNELLVGNSASMKALKVDIAKLSRSQAPVFIYGESGVGKELVARLIHSNGPRAAKPFVPVNCAAISSELMESEFFGHMKGSFTGAIANKEGLFVAAKGGTLFLDEIAELPLAMQVKLLRAIQEHAVKPVGGVNEIPTDVRILSASNKNLQEEIKQGRFRQELYYRINVIELHVPSLRERIEDIPLLSETILKRLAEQQNISPMTLSVESIAALQRYSFPGNVRELENILERAIALCNHSTIQVSDLLLPDLIAAQKITVNPVIAIPSDLDDSLDAHQRDLILKALEKTKWNKTAAARLLGVSFRVLRYRLKKLGIE